MSRLARFRPDSKQLTKPLRVIHTGNYLTDSVTCVAVLSDGDRIVSGNQFHFEVWNYDGTQARDAFNSPIELNYRHVINCVAAFPNDNRIVAG